VQLTDESRVIGAETSVYDFSCEDDDARQTSTAYTASNQVPSGARWVEGYSAPSCSTTVPHGSGLKLRVSSRQIVGLVINVSFY